MSTLDQFKEGFDLAVKRFMDECTGCGQCLENCPIFLEPKFELSDKGPAAVVAKVLELLKGGATSAEAYKIAYGCMQGCSTIRCKPACPQGLEIQQALTAAGHGLREAGEGLPPLAYHHIPGHRYYFGRVFGDLAMKDSEIPWLKEAPPEPEAVDVVLFISCIAHAMPHLALEAMDILRKMQVNFVAIGARDLCCGAHSFFMVGVEEAAKVSEKYISTLSRFRPKKVVSLCAACAFMGDTVLPMIFSMPFESLHITEFLADNLDKLPFTEPLNKVVTVHDSCSQRMRGKWEMPRKLLQAIPGATLVEMEHSRENNLCCGAVPTTYFPGTMGDYHSARLDEARRAGADVMTTICASCHSVFCGFEKQYPFEIKHVVTLVAEAMGIHHEDKLKKYLLTGDPDKVLAEVGANVAASDLSLCEFKHVLPSYFETLCVNRRLSSQ